MKFSALFPKALKPQDNRGRLVLWTCLAGLFFGLLAVGEPLDDLIRDVRNRATQHPADGAVTLVAIDDRSLAELGRFPWPRSLHGKLAQELYRMGAKRIFFDVVFSDKSDAAQDQAFAQALQPIGKRAILPVMLWDDPATHAQTESYPLPAFAERATLANINLWQNVFGTVRRMPYSWGFKRGIYRSFSTELAGLKETDVGDYPVDFSIDYASVPKVSALDVVRGKAPSEMIKGKDVIIGVTFHPFTDSHVAPGYGQIPGVYFHILGAETLREGQPYEVPWPVTFFPALFIVISAAFVRKRIFSVIAIGLGASGFIALPFLIDRHFFVQVVPSLFLLTVVGIGLCWSELRHMYRLRGTTNAVTGLPNLAALQQRQADSHQAMIAARIHNYAAVVSTLPPEAEKALVDQIAKRLTVGALEPNLYQGDEGIFAWFGGPSISVSHLDALHTLFRSPVVVHDHQFDLKITFGLEAEFERSVANRLASALVAADEAVAEGLKWKEYDPSKLEDATWKLSLLSQLEYAIDAGDLWVAYQPKLDLTTDKIVGAEALARWTHPEKGPISPIEFILAAEQSNRIEKLTHFVLDRAIRSAALINAQGVDFDISVNLSGRLINDEQICVAVSSMLKKYKLKPDRLILEVTETAALGSAIKDLDMIHRLRELGVRLSVDDYGTGMSTLEYLQRLPATEIKIDRTFVMSMRENNGTKMMVNSTIQLAHSLGQKVVAEGVEDQETLDELRRMNCDIAQGYLIARPMTFKALSKKLMVHRASAA